MQRLHVKRAMWCIGTAPGAAMQWCIERLTVLLAPSRLVCGVNVYLLAPTREADHLAGNLEQVFRLVAQVDPRRWAQFRRDCSCVVVLERNRASFWPGLRACVLPAIHVGEDAHIIPAAQLVHEATHARIHRAGLRYLPDLADRMEVRCISEQLHFLARVSQEDFEGLETIREWYASRRLAALERATRA